MLLGGDVTSGEPLPTERLYTIPELAELHGRSTRGLRRAVREGRLRVVFVSDERLSRRVTETEARRFFGEEES